MPFPKSTIAYTMKPAPTMIDPMPAIRNASARFRVIPQAVAISIRPPSSGNPGIALNAAKIRLISPR